MRIIFMGTPGFAVPALDALVTAGHEIVAVYTRPPQPAGRGKPLVTSAVQQAAERHGIAVYGPSTLRSEAEQAIFAQHRADIAVVAAYGLLLPPAILDAPRLGCINVHASLLPRWRGAAPIQRAILAGDDQTGVTIMQMEAGLDTGPMICAEATPVAGKTAGMLTDELAEMGARLVVAALLGSLTAVRQPEDGVTLAPKISKAEARLDFGLPAEHLERCVRAYNPAPGAWTEIAGERLKIMSAVVLPGDFAPGVTIDAQLAIGTGAGVLQPVIVQRAGKPPMPVAALLNGWPVASGTLIG